MQIAEIHTAIAVMADLRNIMSGFLDAREAYRDGWHVAGMRVTAC